MNYPLSEKYMTADLWSNPEKNRRFFASMGLNEEQIIPVKLEKIKEAGKQFAESFVISDSLMKEITSRFPMRRMPKL